MNKRNSLSKAAKKAVVIVLIITLTTVALIVASRVARPNDEEFSGVLEDLLPRAKEYSELIFGAGIPPEEGQEGKLDSVSGAQYRKANESYGFKSVEEMKSAFSEVFSSGYIESISYAAFDGYDEMNIQPRYKDISGELNVDITNEGSGAVKTDYDISSAKVSFAYGNDLRVTINGKTDGDEDAVVEIKLVKENGEWKIDSPIY